MYVHLPNVCVVPEEAREIGGRISGAGIRNVCEPSTAGTQACFLFLFLEEQPLCLITISSLSSSFLLNFLGTPKMNTKYLHHFYCSPFSFNSPIHTLPLVLWYFCLFLLYLLLLYFI